MRQAQTPQLRDRVAASGLSTGFASTLQAILTNQGQGQSQEVRFPEKAQKLIRISCYQTAM
jgi:hypothetical protein